VCGENVCLYASVGGCSVELFRVSCVRCFWLLTARKAAMYLGCAEALKVVGYMRGQKASDGV
jgi:hypothetical protein